MKEPTLPHLTLILGLNTTGLFLSTEHKSPQIGLFVHLYQVLIQHYELWYQLELLKESNIVKRIKFGSRLVIRKKNHFFSRVRVEDIASTIRKLFYIGNIQGETFNISDNLPASSEKVYKYAANILKIKNFKIISTKKIKGKMLKSFYKDSKKVSNKKIKKKLKFKLKYPTYKKGLSDLIY